MRILPVYAPPGRANSQAMVCPLRASLAHLLAFAGFCSIQNALSLSVNVRRLVCPSQSVHVLMCARTGGITWSLGVRQLLWLALVVFSGIVPTDPRFGST